MGILLKEPEELPMISSFNEHDLFADLKNQKSNLIATCSDVKKATGKSFEGASILNQKTPRLLYSRI